MNAGTTQTSATTERLRNEMVDRIRADGHATAPVEQAMRVVPRHRFVPRATVQDAYADIAVITKRDPAGAALSCASVPAIVAMMLDQLDVRPGQRILEIGAGTGYNAALLAHLTGPSGEVTTIDIDPEVTAQARQALDATGYQHVRVLTADGALGDPRHGPYDRIIVTVGAWDLPPAWREQLVDRGRLVVPLRWRSQTRSVPFTRHGDRLHGERTQLCGFVPMIGQDGEHTATLDPDHHLTLFWDTDQPIGADDLAGLLDQPRTDTWSGVTVGPYDPFDGIWLNLTATEPGTCRITADTAAVNTGLCTPAIPTRSPALVEPGGLTYLTLRRLSDGPDRRFELGAAAHGATGPRLAERLCQHIRTWNHDRDAQPTITATPTGGEAAEAGHLIIRKNHVRLDVAPPKTPNKACRQPAEGTIR